MTLVFDKALDYIYWIIVVSFFRIVHVGEVSALWPLDVIRVLLG